MDPVVIFARLLLVLGCSCAALVPAGLGLSDTFMAAEPQPRPFVAVVPATDRDQQIEATPVPFMASSQVGLERGPGTVVASVAEPAPIDLRFEPAEPIPPSPVRVRIPSQGIDARIVPVGVTVNGEMEAPAAYDVVGWYRHGARPGEVGRAVLAGHLDSRDGPAVFFQLGLLQPGDTIEVQFGDGSESRQFTVRERVQYPVDGAPLGEIFGSVGRPELVLITCAGEFEGPESGYSERVVVYADYESGP